MAARSARAPGPARRARHLVHAGRHRELEEPLVLLARACEPWQLGWRGAGRAWGPAEDAAVGRHRWRAGRVGWLMVAARAGLGGAEGGGRPEDGCGEETGPADVPHIAIL